MGTADFWASGTLAEIPYINVVSPEIKPISSTTITLFDRIIEMEQNMYIAADKTPAQRFESVALPSISAIETSPMIAILNSNPR